MKVGWATPLHHSSAIGRFSIGVAQALAERGVQIDLLRTERAKLLGEPRLPSELKIINLAGMSDYHTLSRYDLLVYNIGDNASFHQYAVDAAMAIPGICIFHDLLIFNLFHGWMVARGQADRIGTIVDEIYGMGTYTPPQAAECRLTNAVTKYPMLEWLAPYALAAVAHGRHYLVQLTESCAGPVRHIPLAYDLPAAIRPMRARREGDLLRLITIGHINENKLCAEIIRVLGGSRRLAQHCTYRLAGPISEKMRNSLGLLAKGLRVSLEMTGVLSHAGLVQEIENADAVLCLRRPVLEGASASAIEAMLSGRPTVVLDHGFYQELPDDLTLKVPPDFEMRDLERKMMWLLDHPEDSRLLGQRAAAWAREAFSFRHYADAFLQLAHKAVEAEPLMWLGRQLGQELLALGAVANDPAAVRIAQAATKLFSPGGVLCRQI
jgi:glycosyltransferase involved in cell wall biosynthesis